MVVFEFLAENCEISLVDLFVGDGWFGFEFLAENCEISLVDLFVGDGWFGFELLKDFRLNFIF
jgi:hypothetical protein